MRHLTRLLTAAICTSMGFGAGASVAQGQLATLLKDIRPSHWSEASDPTFLGSVDGITYFSAIADDLGRELWTTDGTPEGTHLFDDRCPGPCGSVYTSLGLANGHLFLTRKTDFLAGNIVEVRAVSGNPPSAISALQSSNEIYLQHISLPGWSAALPDHLVAWVNAYAGPWPLMSSDGTSNLPTVALTLPEGASKSGLYRVGPRAYFWVYDGPSQEELWSTDGTPAGTSLEHTFDIRVGEPAAAVGDDLLIFTGSNGGRLELWGFEPSAAVARRLVAFPDSDTRILRMAASGTHGFVIVDSPLSGQELWATDGTPSGTRVVTSFGFPEPFGDSDLSVTLHGAADRAYFFATDGLGPVRLWVSAGSPGTTRPLTDICDDSTCFEDSWIDSVGAQAFFLREDLATGIEVWTTDGTVGGTHILRDACPGPCPGFGQVIAAGGGRLTYGANDVAAYRPVPFVSTAPWSTASSLLDPVRGAPALDPNHLTSGTADGGIHYFGAFDSGRGIEPWVSRGTTSTTLLLADIAGPTDSNSAPHGFAVSGATVAFIAETDTFLHFPWLTDGTEASTRPVSTADFPSLDLTTKIESLDERFVALGHSGLIHAIDPVSSQAETIQAPYCLSPLGSGALDGVAAMALGCNDAIQIWTTDGTPAGTSRRFDLPADFNVRNAFRRVGDRLLMEGGTSSERLYALAVDYSGITPLTSPGVVPERAVLPEGEDLAFFTHAERLWRTDGTPAGTDPIGTTYAQLLLLNAVRSPSGYDLLVQVDTFAYEIWTSDGTAAGTHVRATVPAAFSAAGIPAARENDRLFFILPSADFGYELWVLDDGSSEPRSLRPASIAESGPRSPVLVGVPGGVLFSACDTGHGCELWRSDGAVAGAHLVQDISPGPTSSDPHAFLRVGSTLYFAADDGLHGVELWTLPLDGGPACRATEQTLCLESARFQVAATWRDFAGNSGDAAAVAITGDTGYFWFFDDANVELILKLIDGSGYNGHHWVYYGALSNVEYTFTVTDSETGAAKRYFNPAARFASSGDITAFGPNGAHAAGGPAEAMTRAAMPPEVSLAALSAPQGLPGACVPSPTRFCILDNRFAVTATWRDFAGNTGTANAGTLTDDTGYLWFFDEANVEVVLKMVDAGAFNGHFWVYYGALSNVEYTLTVTDTVAGGPPKIYRNPLGQFGSFGDIQAFPAP